MLDILDALSKMNLNSDAIAPILLGVFAIWYLFWIKPEREELKKYKDSLHKKTEEVPDSKEMETLVDKSLDKQALIIIDKNKEILHQQLLQMEALIEKKLNEIPIQLKDELKKSKDMCNDHNYILHSLVDKLAEKGIIDKIEPEHSELTKENIDKLLHLIDKIEHN